MPRRMKTSWNKRRSGNRRCSESDLWATTYGRSPYKATLSVNFVASATPVRITDGIRWKQRLHTTVAGNDREENAHVH
jgi:hypothetical protein